MRKHLITAEDVEPGRIVYDSLVLDPELGCEEQCIGLSEDLLQVEFPNGCVLDVGWYPEMNPSGLFAVELNLNPDGWEPYLRQRCRGMGRLVRIVRKFAVLARGETRRYPVSATALWPEAASCDLLVTNKLVIDTAAPWDEQVRTWGAGLFEACYDAYVLTIGWEPPGEVGGEFVVRLWEDPLGFPRFVPETGMWEEHRPEDRRLVEERRSGSVEEMVRAARELGAIGRRRIEDDTKRIWRECGGADG